MSKEYHEFDEKKFPFKNPTPNLSKPKIVRKVRHNDSETKYTLINKMTEEEFYKKKEENGNEEVNIRNFLMPIRAKIKDLDIIDEEND
jgi:hypothetical protein